MLLVEKLNNQIKAIAFDLDGTLYSGSNLIPGAAEIIDYLTVKGYSIFYFTNNSARNKQQIIEKLQKMRLPVKPEHVYCCLEATPLFLFEKGYKTVFCCGTQELTGALRSNSFTVFEEDNTDILFDAVVVGMNINFSYNLLSQASLVLQRNPHCKFIACNLDASYPIENGYRMPGCGPIVKAIESASGRKVDFIIGKPDPFMVDLIVRDHNLSKDSLFIVGDTEESDIAMAEKADIKSFLLGGITSKKDAISIKTLFDVKKYL